jgi:hypothetical protein
MVERAINFFTRKNTGEVYQCTVCRNAVSQNIRFYIIYKRSCRHPMITALRLMKMKKVLTKGMIVLVLGLVLIAFSGIVTGQDSGGSGSAGPETFSSNTTDPGIIAALYPQATAEFKIYDIIEIISASDILPNGTYSGRQWGSLSITNTADASKTVLGNISATLRGESFTKPEFSGNATWNDTYIHWEFPPEIVINETEFFQMDYYTTNQTGVGNPITLKRSVNKSYFSTDGYQFSSYEIIFDKNPAESYSGRIAYEEKTYSNSSLLFDTFTTDLPVTYRNNRSFLHPITKLYVSEINYGVNKSLIELHHPYHLNFTAAIKVRNNTGFSVKCYPRIFFAPGNMSPVQQENISMMTAIMPSSLLPAYITYASVTTNVSNIWKYWHKDDVRLIFSQTAQLITPEKIGVFRNTTHLFYLDYNGNGAWNGGAVDKTCNFGITGDIPVSGDWNSDGIAEIGAFRPSTHLFYLDYNGNCTWNGAVTDRQYNFGISGDIPVSGDWNNNGIAEIGVFRPSTHIFYLDYDGNGVWNGASIDRQYNFGITGDTPVSGDWNSDGKTEIGVFRNSTHLFYLDYNGNGVWNGNVIDRQYNFGISGDIPVAGDWNADGRTEIGGFRPSPHLFYLDYNGNGAWNGASVDRQYNFGITSDIPLSGKW